MKALQLLILPTQLLLSCSLLFCGTGIARSAFQPISLPDAKYIGSTKKINITVLDGTPVGTLSDGAFQVSFLDNPPPPVFPETLYVQTAGSSWQQWGSPPDCESSTPRCLYFAYTDNNAGSLVLSFSEALQSFGVEVELADPNTTNEVTVNFFKGSLQMGSITRVLGGPGNARLFAAQTDSGFFDWVQISCSRARAGYAIAQLRYAVAPSPPPQHGPGSALEFLGGYVAVPAINLSGRSGLTIEAWIRPGYVGSVHDLFRQAGSGQPDWLLEFQGASVFCFGIKTETGYQELRVSLDPGDFTDGAWHHLAVAYNGETQQFFRDGVLRGSTNKTGVLAFSETSSAIGAFVPPSGAYTSMYSGDMDEIRIWSAGHSVAEINQTLYKSLAGNEPGLEAYWRLDEGYGSRTVYDSTSHGRTGSLVSLWGGALVWITSGALLGQPIVRTIGATDITTNSATLNGSLSIYDFGALAYFEWGLGSSLDRSTPQQLFGDSRGTNSVTQLLSGLLPSTTYAFRCVATNTAGRGVGGVYQFSTRGPPAVTTLPPLSLVSTSAVLQGSVNPFGYPTRAWFEWGTNLDYSAGSAQFDMGSGFSAGIITQVVVSLVPGQEYHYRLVATNIFGQFTGSDQAFTPPLFDLSLGGCCFVYDGSVSWSDYNRDGRLDLLQLSSSGTNSATTLFTNGSFAWYEVPGPVPWSHGSAGLPNIKGGAGSWGDYDNDGQEDLLLVSGMAAYDWWWNERGCGIYRNDGGVFTNSITFFSDLRQGAAAWGDYDNDGFLDAIVAGLTDTSSTNLLFHNNRDGTFSPVHAGLPPVFNCSVAWGDYDNDGQLDLLIAGDTGAGCITRIYRNDHGVFTDIGADLTGVASGSVAWGDFDGDGWPDVLIAGSTNSTAAGAVCMIYRNNRDGTFTDIGADLPGVFLGSAVWGDYDNDGQLDLLLTGIGTTFGPARIYRNNSGKLSDIAEGLPIMSLGLPAWGDFDGDGKLDLALIGSTSGVYSLGAYIFKNSLDIPAVPPNRPTPPSGLASSVLHNSVTLSWNPATDPHTPSAGLTYNVRVGTTPGGGQIVSPESDVLTGQRRVPQMGNAQQCLHYWPTNLAIGTYYWSVQAVNQSFVGSSWPPEQTFSISSGPPIAVTLSVTNVLCCSALLNGMARPGALPTLAWFDWGTDSASLSNVTPPIALTPGVLPQTVLQTVELGPRTTFFFRFAASNSAALVRGTVESFTTEGPAPEVATFGVSNVNYTTALVMGAWGASSPAADVFIEWGASAAYGQVAPAGVLHPRPAVALDGVDDLVAVGWGHFPLVTNTFSMELRARPAAARAPGAWGVGGQRYAIFPDHGSLTYGNPVHAGAGLSVGTNGVTVFEASDNYMPAVATYDFYSTNWMHFAVVYDSHEPHLYIDGVHVRTGLVSGRIVHPSADLGGNTNLGYGQYQGEIQEVRIWGTPLDAGTIQAWMNRPLTPEHLAYSQLLAYWPLDEGAGTTTGDRGPMKHDGQLLNGAGWGSGSLSADRLFAVALTNLSPGTTYHFRATARNAGGVYYGTDQTFTTLPLPRVLGATPQTGGKWLLRFDGIAGANYVVEVSTNLLAWTARTSLTAGPDGSFTFLDDSASAPIRFYRLKVP